MIRDGKLPSWVAAGALLALALSACAPRFNWRQVQSENGFVALFPAKVARENRTVLLGSQRANLVLTGAEVDHVTFAVGVANLDDHADLTAARADFEASLLANLNHALPKKSLVDVGLIANRVRIPAEEIVATDDKRAVTARFAIRANRVVEMLVAVPPARANEAEIKQARDTFFQGIELF